MAYNGFALDKYLNAADVTRQLDELIKKPVYSVRPDRLKLYEEEYFEKKCSKSKEMITEAKTVIPGGVQHNLAFNYPFPIVIEKAEEEGVMAAEIIKTGHGHVNYDVIPGVIYTEPEIAMVGKTEAQLKSEGVEYAKGSFPLQANSRARAYDQPDGLIKVLTDKKTSRAAGED